MTTQQQGNIIAITGGPGLGKSTLVKQLAEYYNATAIVEGEEQDLPERIITDIRDHTRLMELILFFRNSTVSNYLKAEEFKSQGQTVILDTFWLTNALYIDEWIEDEFERQLFHRISSIDKKLLSLPDVTICLTANDQTIEKFLDQRERSFETSDTLMQYIGIRNAHDVFFKEQQLPNTEYVDRTDLDFENLEDLKIVTTLIDRYVMK